MFIFSTILFYDFLVQLVLCISAHLPYPGFYLFPCANKLKFDLSFQIGRHCVCILSNFGA